MKRNIKRNKRKQIYAGMEQKERKKEKTKNTTKINGYSLSMID